MDLKGVQKCWDRLGRTAPLVSMLPSPLRGTMSDLDQFFAFGQREIDDLMAHLRSLGINFGRKRALDFGCGLGRSTQAFADYFDEIYGVDIAPSILELANQYNRHVDKCKYFLNQTNDLSLFTDNSIDLIWSYGTLQLMEPRYCKNYLKEFLRILVPRGVAVFQLPSGPAWTMTGLIFRVAPVGLLNSYRKAKYGFELYGVKRKDVLKLLERAGGTILDIREDGTPGKSWVSFQYHVSK